MRVGILGAGLMGRRRALAAVDGGDTVVAIGDVDERKARELARTVGAVVEAADIIVRRHDLDAIVVTTPPAFHAPLSVVALSTGKHVLCEKPLAASVADAETMVQAATEHGRVLKCGFNLRSHPAVFQAFQWFRAGAIGDPLFLRARLGTGCRPGFEREWRVHPELSGGGELMDQGVHLVDLTRWFFGEVVDTQAMFASAYWDIAPVEENVFLLLRTEGGSVASLHASWTQWTPLFSLEIYGERGSLTVEGLGGAYGTERVILRPLDHVKPFREEVTEYRGEDRSWTLEWREFTDAIHAQREPAGSGRDGLEALKVVERVYAQLGVVPRVVAQRAEAGA